MLGHPSLFLRRFAFTLLALQMHAQAYYVIEDADDPECPLKATSNTSRRMRELEARLLEEMGMRVPHGVPVPAEIRHVALNRHIFRPTDEKAEARKLMTVEVTGRDDAPYGLPAATFRVSQQTMRHELVRAVLAAHLRAPSGASADAAAPDSDVHVRVFRRLANGELGESLGSHRFPLPKSAAGEKVFLTLDHDAIGSWWKDEPHHDFHLFVSAEHNGQNLAIHPQDTDAVDKEMQVGMKLRKAPSRQRRDDGMCQTGEKTCCVKSLKVDFKTLGWTFVLAPNRFDAHYCVGECTRRDQRALYSEVARLGKVDRAAIAGGTCCHPAEYDQLEIIYMNAEKEIVSTLVDGMIVKSCTCA